MEMFPINQAKAKLSRLVRDANAGQTVIITNGSTPVARLVPYHKSSKRLLGRERDKIAISGDFDDALPDELLRGFQQ
ncbi:MAG: type II toxin-antitoxin system Phd/YefM family antitoxin [Acidimicrobiales bacterium]